MAQLGIVDLCSLDDGEVKSTVTATFVNQLKNSPSVKAVFFGSEPGTVAPANADFVDRLATSMVCSSIALSSLYGFSKCVKADDARQYWRLKLTDANSDAVTAGQALYTWAFPEHCRSANASFRDYLNDGPQKWGQQLADTVTAAPFINSEMLKILGQPNWLEHLNLFFFKIQQLDSSQLGRVLNAWTAAYSNQGITNTWNHRTFIPAQSFNRVPDQFIGEVNAAISVKSVIGTTFEPGQASSGRGGRSFDRYGFGVAVQQYLEGKPTELGLTTGESPDNDPEKGSGCFIAGTRVRLADGREVAIEAVREGDAVLGKGGGAARQSAERVVLELEQGEEIYGIDDGTTESEPFFSAGHLFWTPEGWKAIDPEIALRENPDRQVLKLGPGDVVFRLRTAAPVAYEEVRIRAFTRAYLPEGSRLHGLHLVDGPSSYHANDYLVAMNYPELTVRRLAEGFARLSEAEMRHLEGRLAEIMPLLTRSVGPFIGPALRRALSASRSLHSEVREH